MKVTYYYLNVNPSPTFQEVHARWTYEFHDGKALEQSLKEIITREHFTEIADEFGVFFASNLPKGYYFKRPDGLIEAFVLPINEIDFQLDVLIPDDKPEMLDPEWWTWEEVEKYFSPDQFDPQTVTYLESNI